jgi:hypothetical protein
MKIFSKIIFCVVLSTFFYGCRRSSIPDKNSNISIGNYEEDLSAVRIKYESKPVVSDDSKTTKPNNPTNYKELPQQINEQLDIVLDSIATRNKNIRYSSGYRIQVFVGNDRKEMEDAKVFIYQNFPELSTYLTFSQPTYKLKAGDFTSRLDAERYFATIKQRFTMAMIVPERIDVKKSMQTN